MQIIYLLGKVFILPFIVMYLVDFFRIVDITGFTPMQVAVGLEQRDYVIEPGEDLFEVYDVRLF